MSFKLLLFQADSSSRNITGIVLTYGMCFTTEACQGTSFPDEILIESKDIRDILTFNT